MHNIEWVICGSIFNYIYYECWSRFRSVCELGRDLVVTQIVKMKIMKYSMILLLVIVLDKTKAGGNNDDIDTDSSKTSGRTYRQNNQYYAYVNPKFTDITNRMNQMSASIRAFRNQNKLIAFAPELNLLKSQYTKQSKSYTNLLRPVVLNRPATKTNTIQRTLYQENWPTTRNINTIEGTHRNTVYQKQAGVLNRPKTTNINMIQSVAKLEPTVKTIYKPKLSNINTVGIKTKTLPNRIVYTNPITGGKTIFVRDIDENTYIQTEKAVNSVVQVTTPSSNRIVPLPVAYNTQTEIPTNEIPYYQINTTPVPTAAPILDNYIQPATSQVRGDQYLPRMNANQSPTVRDYSVRAPSFANYDLPANSLETPRPVQGTMVNNQMQPHSTVNNRQTAAEYPMNYQMPAFNAMSGSQITNNLATSKNYPTRNQQTNPKNYSYQSPSNQAYTNSINPPEPTPIKRPPTIDTGNALNFVRAFFQQLMQHQQPPKNKYQIATSPTSKHSMY